MHQRRGQKVKRILIEKFTKGYLENGKLHKKPVSDSKDVPHCHGSSPCWELGFLHVKKGLRFSRNPLKLFSSEW